MNDPIEEYPGQYTTPKGGCPVCHGPIDVARVDTGLGVGWHDYVAGRWSCPRGCDPRVLRRDVTGGETT